MPRRRQPENHPHFGDFYSARKAYMSRCSLKSKTTPSFWRDYKMLPPEIRKLAHKKYQLWKNNPYHPSLHFKPVKPKRLLYSVRINDNYRAIGLLKGDTVTWYSIDSHDNYEKNLKIKNFAISMKPEGQRRGNPLRTPSITRRLALI